MARLRKNPLTTSLSTKDDAKISNARHTAKRQREKTRLRIKKEVRPMGMATPTERAPFSKLGVSRSVGAAKSGVIERGEPDFATRCSAKSDFATHDAF